MLCMDIGAAAKPDMFKEMLLYNSEFTQQAVNELVTLLMEREKMGDTCIADGIALAHAQSELITVPVCMAARLKTAVPWDENGNSIHILIMLLVPAVMTAESLQKIRKLMKKLADEEVAEKLSKAISAEELSALLT